MIRFTHRGSFNKTEKFFIRMLRADYLRVLERYGEMGVEALSAATPEDTGKTAGSWGFEIERGRNSTTLAWTNDNQNDGLSIALLIQYGHGTGDGSYITGIDYINPAIRPVFEKIAREAWKEVTR
jgi:hypothetical protein